MSTKPTVILIPGAWHSVETFDAVTNILRSHGYPVKSVPLPSNGSDPLLMTIDDDVQAIRTAVKSVIDGGGEVVLVMHSYGSIPGAESMRGLGKKERAKNGERGGVIRLVYMAAFTLHEGGSLLKALGGKPMPWHIIKGDHFYPENPQEIFYNDLPASEQELWASRLTHHSWALMRAEVTYAPWRYIPSTYIICENDKALQVTTQWKMVKSAGDGVFETETCTAGHSPFLSQPEVLADALRRAAGEKVGDKAGAGRSWRLLLGKLLRGINY